MTEGQGKAIIGFGSDEKSKGNKSEYEEAGEKK